ncbi:MAG: hypothetical protein M3R15_04425 [Acidobacteriota bacterium]|nr:hypothetical protein [Acidobacteriota bacterium]
MRAEAFDSFCFLLTGVLVGEAKHGTVHAAVFAPADYQPQRLSDLLCRHRLSHQAFMAALTRLALQTIYPMGLPRRLFWIADATTTEKPSAERVSSVHWFHRTKRVAGRKKKLKSHCYLFAAHLYRYGKEHAWASVLCGALLYVKGRSLPELTGELTGQLRLPPAVRHVWVVDRGLLSRPLLRALHRQRQFTARRQRKGRGRKRTYGAMCHVDKLLTRFPTRMCHQQMKLHVAGRERTVGVACADGAAAGRAGSATLTVRVIVVTVQRSKLKPWYLVTTDLELEVEAAVRAYLDRQQIEVNFDEIKELGLGHYMGRRGQGVRRWPLFLCAAQMLLKFMGTGLMAVTLPTLN